ncbi:MarR family transcriptional regulator, partial [Streptomyces sp. RKCA-744]|nr:MarR family transcriptional regulator [Streptomyces sp. RKCA744]
MVAAGAPRGEADADRAAGAPYPCRGGTTAGAGGGPASLRGVRGMTDDTVAAVVLQWQAVHPGVDTSPMEIIGRINRCA